MSLTKIGVDPRWAGSTGIGVVMHEMMTRAPARFEFVDLDISGNISHPLSPFAISAAIKRHGHLDVFWSAGFVPPSSGACPSVVTVHDLTHLHYYSRIHKYYYNHIYRPLFRKCSSIVCVSEYTRQEFLKWSGIDGEKVHSVPNAVGQRFEQDNAAPPFDFTYIFYPGNHRPYKNINRMIEAFAQSGLADKGVVFVLTGNPSQELLSLVSSLGVIENVRFVGFVPDEDLPAYYRSALLTCFVSLYEGFGLPILESMKSGTPVVTSDRSAMPEVAGNAAVLVDPSSVNAIADALRSVFEDESLRDKLRTAGYLQVKKFDWDRSAHLLWELVETTAAAKKEVRR